MKSDLKKGLWSAEEDQKLISYINRYGIWNWSQMPKFVGLSRSGKSCRLRWMNHLKPNLKRGEFSKEEEESILHFHSLLGNKWSAIASKLPGRTDNDVKNHWHAHLKKRGSDQNRLRKKTKQNDDNSSVPPFENKNIQQPAESNFSFENDIVSSSWSTTTSKDPGVEFRDDSGSSGTFDDDLQCFWDQLCPVENLELRNINDHNMMMDAFSDIVFQDSTNDPVSLYTFYDNDYNCSLLSAP
ncbi:hypothetical protein SSX86_019151 [Deinandra increscens subsp. villosa]|uniref:Homeodomain-like protein n=1 Tax=Deinandra increscens subsp. villosa TaxID=3103831 RepID=A0AAP0CXD0_9ASTR